MLRTLTGLVIVLLFHAVLLCAQTSIVLNACYPVVALDTCRNELWVEPTAVIPAGTSIALVQFSGAQIDTTFSEDFGIVTGIGSAGLFQYTTVLDADSSRLILEHDILAGFNPNLGMQIVVYQRANVGLIEGVQVIASHDGRRGGIFLARCQDTLILQSATIEGKGRGFVGGSAGANRDDTAATSPYSSLDIGEGAGKGYSYAFVDRNMQAGRNPVASGAGGGNARNSGGGGGGGYGIGGQGGMQSTDFSALQNGGKGGHPINAQFVFNSRFFPGSGGGGGHQNDFRGGRGGAGGALVILDAPVILFRGDCKVNVSGADGGKGMDDGAGGGGSGGVIVLTADELLGNVSVVAHGGKGGNSAGIYACYGPGGGGSGGILVITPELDASGVSFEASAGLHGIIETRVTECGTTPAHGSTNGSPGGMVVSPLNFASSPSHIPVVIKASDSAVCPGVQIRFSAFGGSEYSWEPAERFDDPRSATPSLVVDSSDMVVYCHIVTHRGCVLMDSISITVFSVPDSLLSAPVVVCLGDTFDVVMKDSVVVESSWRVNGGGSIVNADTWSARIVASSLSEIRIVLEATSSNDCKFTEVVTVQVQDTVSPVITGPMFICQGDTAWLTTTLSFDEIEWSNGEATSTVAVTRTDTLRARYPGGRCAGWSEPFVVTVNPLPVVRVLSDRTVLKTPQEVAELTTDSKFPHYLWSTGDTTASITVTDSGTYYVTVWDENGCRTRSTPVTIRKTFRMVGVSVSIADVMANVGERIDIIVTIQADTTFPENASAEVHVETNPNVVIPVLGQGWGINYNDNTLNASQLVNLPPNQNSLTLTLPADVVLGDAERVPISPRMVVEHALVEKLGEQEGYLTVTGICVQGQPRLVRPKSGITFIEMPDGLSIHGVNATTEVAMYNIMGRQCMALVRRESSSVIRVYRNVDLADGVYIIVVSHSGHLYSAQVILHR